MGRFRLVFVFLWVFIAGVGSAQDTYRTHIFKGNKNFENKNYDDASKQYLDATKKQEKDFGAHYNLGNTFYKKKMYKEAIASYEKALKLTQNPQEKSAALYNLGNAYMQEKNNQKAVEEYRKALQNDPANAAILKNLQIAKKQQKEKQDQKQQDQNQDQQNQPQQQNPQQNPNQQQGGQNQNPQQGNQDSKDSKDENQSKNDPMDMYAPDKDRLKQEKGNQEGGNQPDSRQKGNNPQGNQSHSQSSPDKKIPKDLEEALMKRIGESEKNTARRVMNNKNQYAQPQSNEKDW